jgi:hypothetical protein
MMAAHDTGLRHAGAIRGFCASRMGMGMLLASATAAVEFVAFSGACWVTLPTIAWLPSLTDTFCTVTVCSPLLVAAAGEPNRNIAPTHRGSRIWLL